MEESSRGQKLRSLVKYGEDERCFCVLWREVVERSRSTGYF